MPNQSTVAADHTSAGSLYRAKLLFTMAAHSTLHLSPPSLRCLCIIIIIFLVLNHATTASASSCGAIFTTPLTLLNGSVLTHLSEPATKSSTSSKICPNIAVNSETCCSAVSDQQIESITHNLIDFRNTLADVAPSALLESLFHHQSWLDLTSQHVQWRNLTAEQQWIVVQYVNIVTPILNGATPCVDAVLTYIQGLLCLSCEVRAGEYYHEGMLKQDGRTCGYANDVCVPAISSVVAALPALLDLYIAFLLTVPTPLPPLASASLSQSYLLRAAMSSGVSATGFCQSAWTGIFTGRYHHIETCTDVVCAILDRGLDWDIPGWLGLTESGEDVIQLRKMRSGEGVTIRASSGSAGGGHGGHRRLLSVAMDETGDSGRLAAVSSFGTFSSVVGGLWSRFHVMHGGLHGSEEMQDAPTTTVNTLRVFPPTPSDLHSTVNGHLMSVFGDDGDTGLEYYPLWLVGCASLEQFGVLCPMTDERSKGHDKAVFLGIVSAVALAVSCAMWAAYRAWRGSGGGSDGGDGGEGLLGVGKNMRKIRAKLGRRLAQRSRPPASAEEAEGILAE